MSTETLHIKVSGLTVDIVRKDIKNLHLGVYPPNGRVRVAVPLAVSNDAGFNLGAFGRKFDFLIAQSILSHLNHCQLLL